MNLNERAAIVFNTQLKHRKMISQVELSQAIHLSGQSSI